MEGFEGLLVRPPRCHVDGAVAAGSVSLLARCLVTRCSRCSGSPSLRARRRRLHGQPRDHLDPRVCANCQEDILKQVSPPHCTGGGVH